MEQGMPQAPDPMTQITVIYAEREACRGCGSSVLQSVLDLGIQYLPRFGPEADPSLPKAPLHLVRCENCDMLQLLHTVEPDLLSPEFWDRSRHNASILGARRVFGT